MVKLIVITAVHDEGMYLAHSIKSLALACDYAHRNWRQIIILDRCSDRSEAIARDFTERYPNISLYAKAKIIWKHSYAENLQTGFKYAVNAKADRFAVVDADIVLDKDYFARVLPALDTPRIASASGILITNPLHQTLYSSAYRAWERNYRVGLNVAAWGASRVYKMEPLLKVGGFKDFASPDTELDMRLTLQGFRHNIVSEAKAYHIRELSIENSLKGQIKLGMSRNELGVQLWKTILHGIFRLRPALIAGHVIAALGKKWAKR